jgi:hypothetical protein
MRQFDVKINGEWVCGIYTDTMEQAVALANDYLKGAAEAVVEFNVVDGQWVAK